MTDYKYHERDYAEKLYQDGLISSCHIKTELRLVATYMRRVLNYKPKKLKEEFYRWCEAHIDQYNQVLHYKIINTAIRAAVKKGSALIQLDAVPVFQPELDYIMEAPLLPADPAIPELDYHCRKLMFTLLCQLKINKAISEFRHTDEDYVYQSIFFRGSQRKYLELKKMAALPASVRMHEDIIHHLYCSGLITPLHSGMIRLDFMNDLYQIHTEGLAPVLTITEFEICGRYFDLYNRKQQIFSCCGCGKLFHTRTNNSNQKYCKTCSESNPYYTPLITKAICCCDCSKEITVSSKDNQTSRCESCYSVYRKQYKARKEKERRERKRKAVDTASSLHSA
ncbi:MAG: hypothetical protein ACRDBO_02595 [Lachnospiraceae bacterium]